MNSRNGERATILITGGSGFIGSHLADSFAARGDRVLLLDDLSTGRLENVQPLLDAGSAELIQGSVLDAALVDDCMREAGTCFHLAAPVGVRLVIDRPLDTLVDGVEGTQTVVEAASRHDRRLVFASTSEIYGKNGLGLLDENADRILGPTSISRWNYSAAKAFGEGLIFAHHREHGLRASVARLFNTVGPRQLGAYGMVLPRFVDQALAGEDLTVYGDGSQSRCFTHVLDAVEALIAITESERCVGEALNVGNPSSITIRELAERVITRAGSESGMRLVPYDLVYGNGFEEPAMRRPDIGRARRIAGWTPSRTVDDAIDDLIAFQRERGLEADPVPAPAARS